MHVFGAQDTLFEVAVIHHTQCGTGFLADPSFRQRTAAATGLDEAALEAAAVPDPHVTVKADVERLLTSPLLSPKGAAEDPGGTVYLSVAMSVMPVHTAIGK